MKLKRFIIFAFSVLLVFSYSASAYAFHEEYKGYIYDEWQSPVPSTNGYLPAETISGFDVGVMGFTEPKDFYVSDSKRIYVLDSGKNRVVILNENFELITMIEQFFLNEEESPLNEPHGIFVVDDKYMYIADKNNNRVVKCNMEGKILQEITKPVSNIYPEQQDFVPRKVVVDSSGVIYVISEGIYYGALMFSPFGRFLGFYGANRVEATVQVLNTQLWRRFLSDEQVDRLARFVPTGYRNFDIDDEDFVYTVTAGNQQGFGEVKKINPAGKNILDDGIFGDLQVIYVRNERINSSLVDISISENGFINVLDFNKKRIFQYDQDSNLVFIFGGEGRQKGTFQHPTSIETIGEDVLVLDERKGNITVFKLTEFGGYVHSALSYYIDGFYNEAVPYWEKVLMMNSNYKLAYIGIGRSNLYLNQYEEAVENFRLGADREGYDIAFKELRVQRMRENFFWIVLFFIFLLVIFVALVDKKSFIHRKTFQKLLSKGGN